ncbi:MAG: pur operon repressor [Aerococcus sp.]|nr:pur operon repressor [Aerococcus sp.]
MKGKLTIMKVKRSHRLIDLTYTLFNHPHESISLPYFVEKYQSAKSSLSEDMAILNDQLKTTGIGYIETTPGAKGGVRFIPDINMVDAESKITELCQELVDKQRILPGGYFYLTDILGQPQWLRLFGAIIASKYKNSGATVIMTIASKGIPLAASTAGFLNIPFVMAQRKTDLTEGSTVSVNYVTGHNQSATVETMALTKTSLSPEDKVLIVDDFMSGGGTFNGMIDLINEFDATCIGGVVFGELDHIKANVTFPYQSLVTIEKSSDDKGLRDVRPGSIFSTGAKHSDAD